MASRNAIGAAVFAVSLISVLAFSGPFTISVRALTWSVGTTLTPPLAIDSKPYVIQDWESTLWLAYESSRSGNFDIYIRTFTSGSWDAEQRLTTGMSYDLAPSLVQLSNGNILLIWSSDASGTYALWHRTYDGSSWGSSSQLTFPVGRDANPSLLRLANGTVWLFWSRETLSGQTVLRHLYYRAYNSGTWSGDRQFSTAGSEQQPNLLQLDDGSVWVTYAANRVGNLDVYYRKLTGTSWSAETPLMTNANEDRQSWLMQDNSGLLYVFWARCVPYSGQNCQDDVFYKTSSNRGATWSAEVVFTVDPQGEVIADSHPTAVHAMDKMIYVFWGTNLTGPGTDFDIYYSRSDPILIHDLVVLSPTMAQYKPRKGEVYTSTVRVYNGGDYPDTASLTVEIDGSVIGSPEVLLQPGQTASYTYNTDTSDKPLGPHDLNVSAAMVPGEVRMVNNQVSSKFYVLSPGDVQRDGLVNVEDLTSVGASFGSTAGGAIFNPESDLNYDGRIDVSDLATTGAQFGQQVVLPPDFDLASSNYYPKLAKGTSTSVTIIVRSVSGFGAPVTLGATTTAPGVTVSIPSSQVVPPGTSALSLTASLTAVPGNFTVSVTGSNATVSRSINLSLQVSSAEFTMSPSPTALTIARGGPGQSVIITLDYLGMPGDVDGDGTVNIIDLNRVGIAFGSTFGSPNYDPGADLNQDGTVSVLDLTIVGSNFGKTNLVMLAVTGLPSGVSGMLTPTSLNPPGTATLTLTASPTAVTGTFTVTITGTSAMSSQSVTILLTVT